MDHVLHYMTKHGIPLTRDNYVSLAYMGEKTYEDLEGEERAELPDIWNEEGEIIQ